MAFSVTSAKPTRKWVKDLYSEINEDNIANGAASLAYYWLFALFPMMIFLLSLIPYLPIDNVHEMIMSSIRQALPSEAAARLESVISEVTQNKRGGLLSFGVVLTLWAASTGLYAIMQELNATFDVRESRPFWKVRLTAIVLTIVFVFLILGSVALIMFGGILEQWLSQWLNQSLNQNFGLAEFLTFVFTVFRWAVIAFLLLSGFSFIYHFGPDIEQKFRFITPGSVFGVLVLAIASLLFRIYIENFSDYSATYGSLGAVMILMLWLYITGFVLLAGSEVNALAEHYSLLGKNKGEKKERPPNAIGRKSWRWANV